MKRAPVAILLPSLAGGGAERILLAIAGALLDRSFAVDVVVVRAEGALLGSVPEGARLVDLHARRSATAGPALVRYLARRHPSAVISGLDPTNALSVVCTRLVRPRVASIVTQHNTVSQVVANTTSRRERAVIAANARLFGHATKVVAVSAGVADDMADALHIERAAIDVIRNPVIATNRDRVRRHVEAGSRAGHPWLHDNRGPVLLAVGRLVPAKDFVTLVSALAQLPDDHRLIVLGEGDGRAELVALAQRLGVAHRIDFHGFVADPFPFFAAADVFVLSSRWEGLPTVLVEALPFECGIVATDCPYGPREILADGRWGRLVCCGDPGALAVAVRAEIADPHRRLPEAWHEYEVDTAVDQYARLLETIATEPARGATPGAGSSSIARRARSAPWPLKMAMKTAMKRLPVSYDTWRRLGLFRHGSMDDPTYAERVVRMHVERAGIELGRGFDALELGPGDSVASAIVAYALGADHVYLVDVGSFARDTMTAYFAIADHLASEGLRVPDLTGVTDVAGLCRACNATYLTDGLDSLRSMPSASVDIVWSHAVLEHVHRDEIAETFVELARITRPGGVGSHRIDLRDHLNGGLNNLRFSAARWESPLVYDAGWYTNRLQYPDYLDHFAAAGLGADVQRVDRWPALPTPRARLAEPFRSRPDADLLVSGFDVLLRHRDRPIVAKPHSR